MSGKIPPLTRSQHKKGAANNENRSAARIIQSKVAAKYERQNFHTPLPPGQNIKKRCGKR